MKIAPLVLILALLVTPLASADLITYGSGLEATLLYYEPVPAQPGDSIDVYIQIENNGGNPSKVGTLTVLEGGPFTVENEADRVKNIPIIPGQENFLTNIGIRVSKDANEGDNILKVRVQETGSTSYQEFDLPINVQGTTSALSITSAVTVPEEVMPGEEARLAVKVKNVGDTKVRNVDVALDLTDLSIVPTTSSDSKTISRLLGGQETTFSFDLITYPDATARAYRIPITLSYDDEQGNAKSQEETVGIIVGTKPELLVYFDSVDMSPENREGEVVIQFVNKGLAEIKLLEMEVLENDNVYVTTESEIIYVGNIDADDYESAEVGLHVNGQETKVPIRIKYRDALNREYEETHELVVRVPKANGNGGTSVWIWVILLILIAGGVWYWRKRKSGKKGRR